MRNTPPLSPTPHSQWTVIDECPTSLSWRNANFNYSPVMLYTELERSIPSSTIVNNATFLEQLLFFGGLAPDEAPKSLINAPMVPSEPL